MLKTIEAHAIAGKLRIVTCTDRITGAEVEVLCLVNGTGDMRPVARLYPTQDDANAEVVPPRGVNVHGRTLH